MAALRVYFCGSIRGGREDRVLYERIIRKLGTFGKVLTEHIGSPALTDSDDTAKHCVISSAIAASVGHQKMAQCVIKALRHFLCSCCQRGTLGGEDTAELGDRFIHDRDLRWLEEADVVVAEVSQPSLGVGYELGQAVAMKKRILCLFRPSCGRVLSAMIRGAENGRSVRVRDYDPAEIEQILADYFTITFPSLCRGREEDRVADRK